jgi:hypothetical protein
MRNEDLFQDASAAAQPAHLGLCATLQKLGIDVNLLIARCWTAFALLTGRWCLMLQRIHVGSRIMPCKHELNYSKPKSSQSRSQCWERVGGRVSLTQPATLFPEKCSCSCERLGKGSWPPSDRHLAMQSFSHANSRARRVDEQPSFTNDPVAAKPH